MLRRLLVGSAIIFPAFCSAQKVESFNDSWEFVKDVDSVFVSKLLGKNEEVRWEKVALPHTANIEPIQKKAQQWQGTCYYRKYFSIPSTDRGKHIAIQFDAAMQVADVYLNGKHIVRHAGGYLPFYVDVSDRVLFDTPNSLLVKLNNEDNGLVPPGKPIKDLDFNYYSGIYRNAWLITKDRLRITNAVAESRKAGGGVFIHYENVTPVLATLAIKTEARNDAKTLADAQVQLTLVDPSGKVIGQTLSKKESIECGAFGTFNQEIKISNPVFWSPETPYLYRLTVTLMQGGKIIDTEIIRTGVKTVRISKEGFYLNEKRVVIRGTNRHQDYPYIGNAVPDNAQYRDAYKIKSAGFNFVRTSHYPQSPAFLDACDELGLMVMDAIPGWQFVGSDVFQKSSFNDIRDMIHRDRNHASIILWEASLNESNMKKDYMQKANEIVHEELPFAGYYSAGWMNDVYDVFLPARQHAKAPDYWKKYDQSMPLLIAEYGDWEYYAQNAGFNQTAYKDLKEEERTSRQLRGFGEKRLLQQALNFQEAHNDNLVNPMLGDANWLMFDYNRGYADDIESSGIMDIVRLPKFAYYFYKSQVDPAIKGGTDFNKPVLFIANYWNTGSAASVRIYSNCDEVELAINGVSMGKRHPDKDQYSSNLKHPPFTFDVATYEPGSLTAVGYIAGKKVIEQRQSTPGAASKIRLRVDYSGRDLKAGADDVVFVYADVTDAAGTVVSEYSKTIEFKIDGPATLLSPSSVSAEAGISTMLLKSGRQGGKIKVSAAGSGLQTAELTIESKE